MKKINDFYLFLIGKGEGCDYSIACNKDFIRLNSKSHEEAIEETKNCILDYHEDVIDRAVIFEIKNKTFVDVKKIRAKKIENKINDLKIVIAKKEKEIEMEKVELKNLENEL